MKNLFKIYLISMVCFAFQVNSANAYFNVENTYSYFTTNEKIAGTIMQINAFTVSGKDLFSRTYTACKDSNIVGSMNRICNNLRKKHILPLIGGSDNAFSLRFQEYCEERVNLYLVGKCGLPTIID